MTNKTHLRESVSNWIVDDSHPVCEPHPSDIFLSSPKPVHKSSLSEIFSPNKENTLFDNLLTKRTCFKPTQHVSVNPSDVFQVIKSFTEPELKRRKLCESTDFLVFPAEPFQVLPISPVKSIEEDEPTPLPPADLDDDDVTFEEDINQMCEVFPVVKSVAPKRKTQPRTRASIVATDGAEITTDIDFGKRGNGNQPWQSCGAAPSKIGKMRRMTFTINSSSPVERTLQVRVRTEDHQPKMHKGKLVLCTGDRCCMKTKVEGRKKPVVQCDERLTELTLPEVKVSSSFPSTSMELYLKPEWNGLGPNKTRPSFDVFVELIDCETGKVHELLSWDTELQSHKFESSHKAKVLENASQSSTSTHTVYL